MKKKVFLIALAMLCGMLTFPAVQAAEEVDNGWKVEYLNDALSDDTHYARFTDEDAHSGDYSLHINYPDGLSELSKIKISHDAIPTFTEWDAANQFRIQFFIKGDYHEWGIELGTFDCRDDTAHGTLLRLTADKITFEEPDENGWIRAYYDFCYPYTNKSDFQIYIYGEARDVYIDDISVVYNGTAAGRTGYSLLTDGGFEPIPEPTGEMISNYGWSLTDSTADGDVKPEVEIVSDHKGNKMLHVKYDEAVYNDNVILYRQIATPAGAGGIDWSRYRIYFKAKGSYRLDNIEIGNDQYNDLLRFLTNTDYVTRTELEDGWIQYCVTTAGQNKDGFRMLIHGSCHDMYLDDFAVVKLDANGEEISGDHLRNGTFDNPSEPLSIQADEWSVVKGSGNEGDASFLATRNTTHAFSGNNAMFISAPGSWVDQKYVDFRQKLPDNFDYSKDYTLKLKIYTPYPDINLRAEFSNIENKSVNTVELNTKNVRVEDVGGGWYEYTVSMSPEEGYNNIRFLAMMLVGGIWIDDISLTDEDGTNYIKNGSFEEYKAVEAGEFVLLDENFEDIFAPAQGENIMTVNVNTLEQGVDYALYFAIYKDGSLYDIVKTEYKNAAVGDKELEASIYLDTVEDGAYTAKAFLWDAGMNPYVPAEAFGG